MKKETAFAEITNDVISAIEQGVTPWRKTWGFTDSPQNFFSKHKYRGINYFLISMKNFETPYFATFEQIRKNGGKLKKGAKAHRLYFMKLICYDSKGNEIKEEDLRYLQGDITKVWYIKYDNVFNLSLTDGIDYTVEQKGKNNNVIASCDSFIQNIKSCPTIDVFNCEQPKYMKHIDKIEMPHIVQFESSEDFYSTMFHELIHSTGHQKRLNRKELNECHNWGDSNYGREELTAEMGAAFLCNMLEIDNVDIRANSNSYLNSWLKAIKADNTLIWNASQQAQKAVDFLCK